MQPLAMNHENITKNNSINWNTTLTVQSSIQEILLKFINGNRLARIKQNHYHDQADLAYVAYDKVESAHVLDGEDGLALVQMKLARHLWYTMELARHKFSPIKFRNMQSSL
jgi:hypothetical protein